MVDESCFVATSNSCVSQIRSSFPDAKKSCPKVDAGARALGRLGVCVGFPLSFPKLNVAFNSTEEVLSETSAYQRNRGCIAIFVLGALHLADHTCSLQQLGMRVVEERSFPSLLIGERTPKGKSTASFGPLPLLVIRQTRITALPNCLPFPT